MAARLPRRLPWPARTSTSSAARTQLGRLRCTSLVTPGGSRSWYALSRSTQGCRTTWSGRWRRRRSCRSALGPRSSAVGATGGWSTWCFVIARMGSEETVDADGLFLMIGARPHTEWLPAEVDRDERGFILTGTDLRDDNAWPLDRSPFLLETSMPRVFAAGDVRHGSVKRVASAVGEGSVAIQLLHRLVRSRPAASARPSEGARRRDRTVMAALLGGALSVFAVLLAACGTSTRRHRSWSGSKDMGARARSALDAPVWSST